MTNKWPKKNERPGVDEYGRTGIHYSIIKKDMKRIKELIASGNDINAQDDNGWTGLHFAAQDSNIGIINLMLKHNADPNLYDIYGNGPLWTATINARGYFECVKILLEHNANPDKKNNAGRSPRDMANTIKHGLDKIFNTYGS